MRPPTTRGTRAQLAKIAMAAMVALTGCAGDEPNTAVPTSAALERTPTMAPTPSPHPEATSSQAEGTAVVLTIGDTTVHGQLWDNPAARDLAARLPLALTFSDYNDVEKTGRLDRALTMDGMPAGDDPNPGEIGWYAPSSDLVLYYGDVGYWNGIARLGTFDASGIELLADGPHDITVTITQADS